MADAPVGDDATLLPEATPVSGDDPTAASTIVRRGGTRVDRVGRYVLLDKLGEGGMGVVWSAYDPELDRRIAIKLIRGEADENAKQRFIREARAMAQLHHPGIVAIHDVGTAGDHAYIAMELVRGKTLRAWLKDEERSWKTVLAAFVAAGEGIAVAHRAGVVHRDFKPANVMVGDDGRAVVLDFGLARAPTSAKHEESVPTDPKAWASIDVTHTAGVVGTPAYMAPEQIAGAAFDGRADQFAFCIAAYEALFGVAPFPRESLAAMVGAMRDGAIAAPKSTQRAPARIRRTLVRGLAYEPALRWPDMDALLAELRRDPGRAWMVIGGSTLAIGAVATWIATRPEPVDPCAAKDAEITQVWSADRRAEVERVASRHEVDGSTIAQLDAYVDDLRSAVAQSCAAAKDPTQRATQDRVAVCLDAARSELDGTLAVLGSEGAAATEALADVAWALPDPGACMSFGDVQDGSVASAADVRRLAEAESWLAAGDLERAAEMLAPLLVADEANGRAWRSRVLRTSGMLQLARGEIDAGVAEISRAASLALEAGDDFSFLRAAVALSQQIGVRGGDFVRGEAWLDLAMASARRLGGGSLLQARLLEHRGALRQLARDHPGSVLSLVAAYAITTAMLGSEHRRAGELLAELGTTNLLEGHHAAALPLMTESLRILEATLDPSNAEVMRVRTNALSIYARLGRYAETEREARALVALLDVPDSKNPLALASALSGLAEVAVARGDHAAAIAHYERVWEICDRIGARLRGAAVRAHLATLYSTVGRHADAQVSIAAARAEAVASGLAEDHAYMTEFDLAAVDIASAAGDFARAHALLAATAEHAKRSEQTTLNHKVRAARLAMREGKPGDHAASLREVLQSERHDLVDRVNELLLLVDLERLAGDEPAAIAALEQAQQELGDFDHAPLRREIEARRAH